MKQWLAGNPAWKSRCPREASNLRASPSLCFSHWHRQHGGGPANMQPVIIRKSELPATLGSRRKRGTLLGLAGLLEVFRWKDPVLADLGRLVLGHFRAAVCGTRNEKETHRGGARDENKLGHEQQTTGITVRMQLALPCGVEKNTWGSGANSVSGRRSAVGTLGG